MESKPVISSASSERMGVSKQEVGNRHIEAPFDQIQEVAHERAAEKAPLVQQGEASEKNDAVAQATPVLPTVASTTPVGVTADDNLPLVANDDDLIEKEWVEKAKKIINETKDDPYRREREVARLQADYLRKRYGKELGEAPS